MTEHVRRALIALLILGLAADVSAQAVGVVLDAETGGPVAGAEIVAGADSVIAVTGEDGGWQIRRPLPGVLQVRHIGYATGVIGGGEGRTIVTRLRRRPVNLGAIIVTAGRRLQRLADAVVATEVVSGREIRESGASDIGAVLTERTGIDLAGGHPNGAGAMLQGLDAERLLVLIDGQPFIGRMSGQVDLSRLDRRNRRLTTDRTRRHPRRRPHLRSRHGRP